MYFWQFVNKENFILKTSQIYIQQICQTLNAAFILYLKLCTEFEFVLNFVFMYIFFLDSFLTPYSCHYNFVQSVLSLLWSITLISEKVKLSQLINFRDVIRNVINLTDKLWSLSLLPTWLITFLAVTTKLTAKDCVRRLSAGSCVSRCKKCIK